MSENNNINECYITKQMKKLNCGKSWCVTVWRRIPSEDVEDCASSLEVGEVWGMGYTPNKQRFKHTTCRPYHCRDPKK
jgi:hypothetical protein